MLPYDDPRWKELKGGYRIPYDPTPGLRILEQGGDQASVWSEFWNELHHQGDVDEASYAVAVELIRIQKQRGGLDWNFYALVSTIEIERRRKSNPEIPAWLADSYRMAWRNLFGLAQADLATTTDTLSVQCILGTLALCKGLVGLGAMILFTDKSELQEWLESQLSWSQLYSQ